MPVPINDLTAMLSEFCELDAAIATGQMDVANAYGLVGKMMGKILEMSLKVAQQTNNGSAKN